MSGRAGAAAVAAAVVAAALGVMWRGTIAGEAFVPAGLLRGLAPWSAQYAPERRPPWNPLMYDSVGQFHPWRKYAGEELRAGRLPLWNPYQFCGTPFVANSQSGVLYPGNLLYVLLPAWRAAGWTALLHLVAAALFMAAFLRALGVGAAGRAFGGIAYALSAWQVAWLHLPTFLNTSCWLPLALLCTVRVFEPGAPARRAVPLGLALGAALLAGHLQVAFYVVLATVLLAVWLAGGRVRERSAGEAVRSLGVAACALLMAGALAAPHVLPALELSRQSHRRSTPSPEGYAAYTRYALHPGALATLGVPDWFGNPSRPEAPYFGISRGGMLFNYAEGALYVGLPTLFLAAFALVRRRQRGRLVGWFGALALLALLMALGTAVDALLYFLVPGFGQSGSPGRVLVLWAFALSALGALGLDKLLHDDATPWKSAAAGVAGALALVGVGVAAGIEHVAQVREQIGAGAWQPELARQAALASLSAGLVVALAAGGLRTGWMRALPVALLVADLLAAGANFNPTAPASEVYPTTAAIEALRKAAPHDRVMPVNENWSFAGPTAALPPNTALAYGIRDVQGYDSLFPGRYKAFLDRHAGRDSSPPEVGNMVFARTAAADLIDQAGVRVVAAPAPIDVPGGQALSVDGFSAYVVPGSRGRASLDRPGGAVTWLLDEPTRVRLRVEGPGGDLVLADQIYPGWEATVDGRRARITPAHDVFRRVTVPAGDHVVEMRFSPPSFRLGVYLMLAVVAVSVGAALAARRPAAA